MFHTRLGKTAKDFNTGVPLLQGCSQQRPLVLSSSQISDALR